MLTTAHVVKRMDCLQSTNDNSKKQEEKGGETKEEASTQQAKKKKADFVNKKRSVHDVITNK